MLLLFYGLRLFDVIPTMTMNVVSPFLRRRTAAATQRVLVLVMSEKHILLNDYDFHDGQYHDTVNKKSKKLYFKRKTPSLQNVFKSPPIAITRPHHGVKYDTQIDTMM